MYESGGARERGIDKEGVLYYNKVYESRKRAFGSREFAGGDFVASESFGSVAILSRSVDGEGVAGVWTPVESGADAFGGSFICKNFTRNGYEFNDDCKNSEVAYSGRRRIPPCFGSHASSHITLPRERTALMVFVCCMSATPSRVEGVFV